MNTIITKNDTEKQFKSTVDTFFKKNKINSLLKQSNFCKEKGISCGAIFKFIFLLVFTGKNLFRTLDSENIETFFAKDTVYRFLNSAHFNWRKFLF